MWWRWSFGPFAARAASNASRASRTAPLPDRVDMHLEPLGVQRVSRLP